MSEDFSFGGLPISENIFGKMRGRYSSDAALTIKRGMPQDALRKVQSMDAGSLMQFVDLFNDHFNSDRAHPTARIEVLKKGRDDAPI